MNKAIESESKDEAKTESTSALNGLSEDYKAIEAHFDQAYYLRTYPDVAQAATDGLDPLVHFMTHGWREFRNPSQNFNTREVLMRNPGWILQDKDPLSLAISEGLDIQSMPSQEPKRTPWSSDHLVNAEVTDPLFDRVYYLSRNGDINIGQEKEHYETHGIKEKRLPTPLFDSEYYLRQLSPSVRQGVSNPFEHYLEIGWKQGLAPHVLLEPEHYEEQLEKKPECSHLEHYLTEGWKQELSPHPLFDPEYYSHHNDLQTYECPLIHYLISASPRSRPNYLFSDRYYREKNGAPSPGETELGQYLSNKSHWKNDTSWFFSYEVYHGECTKTFGEDPYSDVLLSLKSTPGLLHYIEEGAPLHLRCSLLFNPVYYSSEQGLEDSLDPLYHYLGQKNYTKLSGHPAFDVEYYRKQGTDWDEEKEPAIVHFIKSHRSKRASFSSVFDSDYYLSHYKDIKDNDLCPKQHFLLHGWYEGRRPNHIMSEAYVLSSHKAESFVHATVTQKYMESAASNKLRILFTSHDASRTGAPAIILRLVQDFSRMENVECISILDRGGPLVEDFQKVSHTYVLNQSVYQLGQNNETHRNEISGILELFGSNQPIAAICNSIETRHLSTYFSENGIPVISLIHEIPDYFPQSEFDIVFEASNKVVYPSQFISQRATLKTPEHYSTLSEVKGQGLLKDGFGSMSREKARQEICKELNLPNDALIILGCGTLDLRKGIDYFASVGYETLRKRGEDDRPAYFIWLGDGDKGPVSAYTFINEVTRRLDYDRNIRFIGSRKNVEPYFVAADLFLMTSRADPFPCVIHEAMAAALPVITFKEGGGAHELIGEHGFAVPMGDVGAMAEKILLLGKDDELRMKLSESARNEILTNWDSEGYFKHMLNNVCQVSGYTAQDFEFEEADNEQKRVYFLSPDWGISGVNTLAQSTVDGLRELGVDARFLFTRGRFSDLKIVEGKELLPSAPYEFLQPASNSPESIWSSLLEWMKKQGPVVIIPNYDYVASSVSPVAPSNVSIVGIAHSDHMEHYEHVYRLGHYWQGIIAVSGQVANKIAKLNATLAEKTTVIYNGVDLPKKKSTTLKSPKDSTIKLLYAGRMVTEQKQVHRFIELAGELEKRGCDFQLTLVGDGDELQNMRQKALVYGSKVRILGQVKHEKILKELSKTHAFVLMSDYEGLPISMLEAMALGCVPVVYDMDSGVPEVIDHMDNGIIIKSKSPKETAEQIMQLQSDPDLFDQLSKRTKESLKEKELYKEAVAKKYAELIDGLFERMTQGNGVERDESLSWASENKILPPPNLFRFI